MATAEEIARDLADHAVTVDVFGGKARVWIGAVSVRGWTSPAEAVDDEVASIRTWLRSTILEAIERALREVPVPGPVSEERLAEIRERSEAEPIPVSAFGTEAILRVELDVRLLLAHIAHLARILQDCAADGLTGAWQAGHLAGWKEGAFAQRVECGHEANRIDRLSSHRVYDAPLVPHPSEESQ